MITTRKACWPCGRTRLLSVRASLASSRCLAVTSICWMLAVMMVADFAFGVADAARRRHFRCRMLWHGALKFLYYMAYIGIVDMVNASLSRSFGGVYMPFLNLFIVYLIITDAVSVIAHMQRLGIPVPDLLRRVLLRSKRKVERRVDEAVGGDDDAS